MGNGRMLTENRNEQSRLFHDVDSSTLHLIGMITNGLQARQQPEQPIQAIQPEQAIVARNQDIVEIQNLRDMVQLAQSTNGVSEDVRKKGSDKLDKLLGDFFN
jgi:hypothetical protein